MEIGEVLREIGFGQREAKIYFTLLKLTSATASKVAERIGVDRTTTYDILSRLIEKGVVSYVIKNNVRYFQAVPPEQLMLDLRETEKHLQEILPELNALAKTEKENTTVEVFKGKEGLVSVLKIMLREKEDYLFIGGTQEFCEAIPIFMRQFVKKCPSLGMRGKLICEEGFGDGPDDIIGVHEKYRMASKDLISTTIMIWGNKTAFFIFTQPYYTILIQNEEVADRQRFFFNHLWRTSKEPTKRHKEKTLLKPNNWP